MRFAKELVTLNSAMQIKGTALIVLISYGNSDHVAHVWWVTGNFFLIEFNFVTFDDRNKYLEQIKLPF